MGKRQWTILAIASAFIVLMTTAWVSKPLNFKQRLERAGIHFTEDDKSYPEYNPGTGRIAYDIRNEDLRPLVTALLVEGYRENQMAKLYDGSTSYDYSKSVPAFLTTRSQHLRIDVNKKTTVLSDFPLEKGQ